MSSTVEREPAHVVIKRPRRMPIPLLGWVGIVVVAFWLIMAVFGPMLTPHPAGEVIDPDGFGPMVPGMWLGSDVLGRDVLSRIMAGAQTTVGPAIAATLLAVFIGGTLALAAAAVGGWIDTALSRTMDAVISVPSLLFGLVAVAALGVSVPVLICTAGVIFVPGAFRIWRSLAVNVNAMDYVSVARERGEGMPYIMRREILPNLLGPVLADCGLRFVFAVLLLSSLSFLGLGIQPPDADWGSMVRENLPGLIYGAPAAIFPAAALATLTIGVNLLVDNLPGRER